MPMVESGEQIEDYFGWNPFSNKSMSWHSDAQDDHRGLVSER